MAKSVTSVLTVLPFSIMVNTLHAAVIDSDSEFEQFMQLPLSQLVRVSVSTASGVTESLRNAPAAMVIISARDIQQRGYTDLSEVLLDLPGFDTVISNGVYYSTSYQRGYRTPFSQRTLLMINGRVHNDLWIQTADISRQYPFSNIARIEVLYGPASAVYGANAFTGIINIITQTPERDEEADKEPHLRSQWQTGSYNTQAIDLGAQGHTGDFAYQWSAKYFSSDEPGLDDYGKNWGYASNRWLGDDKVWGPILAIESNGRRLGGYDNPSQNWGVLGEIRHGAITAGINWWQADEAYGPYYPGDRGQSNVTISRHGGLLYLKHSGQGPQGIQIDSDISYRQNRLWSDWAEAVNDVDPAYSLVSFSHWNSFSSAWQFKQDFRYRVNASWEVNAGLKYEARDLAKNYEVCGYWEPNSFCPEIADEATPGGPLGYGPGVVHSSADTLPDQPEPGAAMASRNTIALMDRGLYLQTIYDQAAWRLQAGVRIDKNSEFGSSTNPRVAAIYRPDHAHTVKLLYGEAFQEPSMAQRFGGWNGRADNAALVPEKASNLELIWMVQQTHWLHDMSLFHARYENVIKEAAINLGERDINGFEYRGRYSYDLSNHAPSNHASNDDPSWLSGPVSGFFYYTWTRGKNSDSWDAAQQQWVDGDSTVGDIAPHKITWGLNVPVAMHWNVNLRANYRSDTKLYGTNPLRMRGDELDAYVTVDAALRYGVQQLGITLKVKNLFNEGYYQPGTEAANSGDDFTQRSAGFNNSLIPQAERSAYLLLDMTI